MGTKNFEPGLTVDAPLYALIARNIVRTGYWFVMNGSAPPMVPFCEHPHLGLWLIALVFKVLPMADWSARVVGHVFYVGFLYLFFVYVRRRADEATAVGAVLLLWSWFRFANFFSNVYLDPGTLFFGAAAVFYFDWALECDWRWGFVSGASLALCAMYKGLTVLGFGPAFVLLMLLYRRLAPRIVVATLGTAAAILGLYYLGIRHSEVPDFVARYFERQWRGRFEQSWNWAGLVQWSFWRPLLQDTYWLVLLAPLAFFRASFRRMAWLPTILVLSFVLMFAPAGRDGAHYRLMILPWLAWLVAAATVGGRQWNRAAVARGSAIFCLVVVLVLQYIPARTHGFSPPPEIAVIDRFKHDRGVTAMILDMAPADFDFTYNDFYAWYTDLPLTYLAKTDPVPSPKPNTVYLLFRSTPERTARVEAAGWHKYDAFNQNTVWLP